MSRRWKSFLAAGSLAFVPSLAFAQAPGSAAEAGLSTPLGHEIDFGVGGYNYAEPGDQSISIHGPKFALGYHGTMPLGSDRRWFLQGDVRGLVGKTNYDGWCYPFVIIPDSTSPNGYGLDVGAASPCSESGDSDWYVEGRALFGRDFVGSTWGWSPEFGLGLRHLSNGTSGVAGYRTDEYLYLPLGVTARTVIASHHAFSVSLEYDQLLHGWQKTRDSLLGGGDVPATPTAPAFTIEGFSDVSFDQHSGWALRASAKYQLTGHWSVEPEYIHWNVDASPVSYETATFTVNGITAQEQLGAYEPLNKTDEFAVRLGFRFGQR
jgi:hypothetical protein